MKTTKPTAYTPDALIKGKLPEKVMNAYLRRMTMTGLERRYTTAADKHRKMALAVASAELEVIALVDATSDFLLALECRRVAAKLEMPSTPGWGITAGSVVCYALGISDLDPLAFGLATPECLGLPFGPGRLRTHIALPICDYICREFQGALIQHFQHNQFTAVCESETADAQFRTKAATKCLECRVGGETPQVFVPMRDLSIQRNMLRILPKTGKIAPKLAEIPLDDPATYTLMVRGDNSDLPFLGRPGMQALLDTMAPGSIAKLTDAVERYRSDISTRYAVLRALFESEPEAPVPTSSDCYLDGRGARALVQAVIAYRTAYLKAHFPDEFAVVVTSMAQEAIVPF